MKIVESEGERRCLEEVEDGLLWNLKLMIL